MPRSAISRSSILKGELLLAVGGRSNLDAPAKFSLPSSIAVDDDGRVYVVDQYFRKVDVFRPAALAEEDGYIGKNAIDKNQKAAGDQAPASSEQSTEPGKDQASYRTRQGRRDRSQQVS